MADDEARPPASPSVKEAQRFPVERFRLVEGTVEVVRFAEIGRSAAIICWFPRGAPESETLLEPLDRLRKSPVAMASTPSV